jgi:hypothetical protein
LPSTARFIDVFGVRASSKIAQKIPFITNELSATRARDPNFGVWRLCGKVVTACNSRNQQYALHRCIRKKIHTTRQRVADRAPQHKGNTRASIAVLRRCV